MPTNSSYGPVIEDPRPEIAHYVPAPITDRPALLIRLGRTEENAARLTAAAAAATSESIHIRGIMTAAAVNNACAKLRALLRDGADDREFIAPLAKLDELEAGLGALGYE